MIGEKISGHKCGDDLPIVSPRCSGGRDMICGNPLCRRYFDHSPTSTCSRSCEAVCKSPEYRVLISNEREMYDAEDAAIRPDRYYNTFGKRVRQ